MKIQYPERGQPLDVDYLYQVARSINSLNDKLSTSKTLSSIFADTGQTSLTTSQIRFYTTKKAYTSSSVAANRTEEITVNFDTMFTKPPIVTATIQNNVTSSVGTNAIVTVKGVSTGLVQLNVTFLKAGAVDININVVAIGT
jgi:hypothetical protein